MTKITITSFFILCHLSFAQNDSNYIALTKRAKLRQKCSLQPLFEENNKRFLFTFNRSLCEIDNTLGDSIFSCRKRPASHLYDWDFHCQPYDRRIRVIMDKAKLYEINSDALADKIAAIKVFEPNECQPGNTAYYAFNKYDSAGLRKTAETKHDVCIFSLFELLKNKRYHRIDDQLSICEEIFRKDLNKEQYSQNISIYAKSLVEIIQRYKEFILQNDTSDTRTQLEALINMDKSLVPKTINATYSQFKLVTQDFRETMIPKPPCVLPCAQNNAPAF